MFGKTFLLAALSAGLVAAFCPPCQQTSQKEAFQKADVVAHIKVNSVSGGGLSGGGLSSGTGGQVGGHGASASIGTRRAASSSISTPAGGASASLPQQQPVTYQVQYIKSFKPKQGGQQSGELSSSGDITCSGVRMIQGQEYLIAGKRNGTRVEITKCGGIPLTENGISNGPIAWTVAQTTLAKELESGFSGSSSSGSSASGSAGKIGGERKRPGQHQGGKAPVGAQTSTGSDGQGGVSSQSSSSLGGASMQSSMDTNPQQSSMDSQGQQSSMDSQGQDQSGQQSGQQGQQGGQDQSSQDSQSQQGQQGQQGQDQSSQQGGQDQQSQQGQQGQDQSGQQGQDQGSQQGGQDSQSQQGQQGQQGQQMRRRADWQHRRR